MKFIMSSILLLSISLANASDPSQTCVEKFESSKEKIHENKQDPFAIVYAPMATGVATSVVELGVYVATGSMILASTPLWVPVAIGTLGVTTIYIAGDSVVRKVKTVKLNRMVKLIAQADLYLGNGTEGKLLLKAFKAAQKKHPELTIREMSEKISDGNKDKSLCNGKVYVSSVAEKLDYSSKDKK